MPNLLNELELTTVEWGVVAIYVCPDSCLVDEFAEEVAFVQLSV